MNYTASDILEACGFDPAGAPRIVQLAAEVVRVAQGGALWLSVGSTNGHTKRYPFCPTKYPEAMSPTGESRGCCYESALLTWAEAMADELDIELRVRFFFGDGRKAGLPHPIWSRPSTRIWYELEHIEPEGSEAMASWWRRSTYPLGLKKDD